METFPIRLMKELRKQETEIRRSVQAKYPQCELQLERIQAAVVDEDEKIQNSFHQDIESDDEGTVLTDEDKKIKEWVLTTSSVVLAKNFPSLKRTPKRSSAALYYENLSFRINPRHYSNALHPVFVQEKIITNEEERMEIIAHELASRNANEPDFIEDLPSSKN